MVKQRSLPFNEVDTEWMLLLDDDMYLPPKMVETMIEKAIQEKADCIVPDVYALHKENTLHRFCISCIIPFRRLTMTPGLRW